MNEALERVVEAKGMVSRIWPRLQDLAGGSAGKQWSGLMRAWKAKPRAERAQGSGAQLVLELAVLNRFLDRHFRSKKQAFLKDKEP